MRTGQFIVAPERCSCTMAPFDQCTLCAHVHTTLGSRTLLQASVSSHIKSHLAGFHKLTHQKSSCGGSCTPHCTRGASQGLERLFSRKSRFNSSLLLHWALHTLACSRQQRWHVPAAHTFQNRSSSCVPVQRQEMAMVMMTSHLFSYLCCPAPKTALQGQTDWQHGILSAQ